MLSARAQGCLFFIMRPPPRWWRCRWPVWMCHSYSRKSRVTFRPSRCKARSPIGSTNRNGQTYASEDPNKLSERVIHVINVLARAELQKLALREAIRASDELVKA